MDITEYEYNSNTIQNSQKKIMGLGWNWSYFEFGFLNIMPHFGQTALASIVGLGRPECNKIHENKLISKNKI